MPAHPIPSPIPEPPKSPGELIELLDRELVEAVRLAHHRAEHLRLVRMQVHLAELKTATSG